MEKVYEVTFNIEDKKYPILFDTKDTAERTVTAITAILTKKGKEKLKFEFNIIDVYSGKDMLELAETMFN